MVTTSAECAGQHSQVAVKVICRTVARRRDERNGANRVSSSATMIEGVVVNTRDTDSAWGVVPLLAAFQPTNAQ